MVRFIDDKERVARIYLNHLSSGYSVSCLSPYKIPHNKMSTTAVYPSRELAEIHIKELKKEFEKNPSVRVEIQERKSGTSSTWEKFTEDNL